MAIWGPGNFERDDSLNVLEGVFEEIIEDIQRCFTFESERTLYEDFGEATIVAQIDILCTLLKHYQYVPDFGTEKIAKWKQDYLDTFDRTINQYSSSPDYIKSRRQVVENTFDEFHDIVKKAWED